MNRVKDLSNVEEITYVPDSETLFMQEIRQYPLLTSEQQKSLLEIVRNGNEKRRKAAIDRLIVCNLRLVASIASKYKNYGVDFMDLVMEGTIGLKTGIERFDNTLGYELSTYASTWIKQAICRYIDEHNSTIRIPVHMKDRLRKYGKSIRVLTAKLGREPSLDEISKDMKLTKDDIEEMILLNPQILSLDMEIDDDESTTLVDTISDSNSISPEKNVEKIMLRERISKLMDTLNERTRLILELRYGFKNDVCMTLEQVGKKLGITRERVRQIENIGLKTLKVKAKDLKNCLFD